MQDEEAIRELVSTWMSATRAGDYGTVGQLIADDAVFMVAGRSPFGKEEFAKASQALKDVTVDGTSEIEELRVLGDWAFIRNRLKVKLTFPDGQTNSRSGYVLTLLRKNSNGKWQMARDANMLTPDEDPG